MAPKIALLLGAAFSCWGAAWHLARTGLPGPSVTVCVAAVVVSLAAVRQRFGVVMAVGGAAASLMAGVALGGTSNVRLATVEVAVCAYVLARPLRSSRAGLSAMSVVAVGLAQVGLARWGPSTWSMCWTAAAVGTLELRRWSPELAAGVDRRITAIGRSIGNGLATASLFVGSCVLLYAPGGLVRVVGSARRPPRSTWTPSSSPSSSRRQARLPFIAQPERARRSLLLAVTAILAAAVAAGVLIQHPDDGPPTGQEPSTSPFAAQGPPLSELMAYADAPWADDLEREQREYGRSHLVSSPIGGFITGDVIGEYTNVVGGSRQTIQPSCSCPMYDVWMLGGSAVFGMGQRDEGTIASSLVRMGDRAGVGLRVRNLGVPGWTLWQEQIRLAHLLSTEPPPDLILVIDGFNDVVGTVVGGTLRGLDDDRPSSLVSDEITDFLAEGSSPLEVGTGDQFGALAARRYREVMGLVTTLTEHARVPTLFYFQPDALSDPVQRASARLTFTEHVPDVDVVLAQALDTAAAALRPEVTDLRDLFDGRPPVFADLVHTNEEGAEVVAAAVLADVLDELGAPG